MHDLAKMPNVVEYWEYPSHPFGFHVTFENGYTASCIERQPGDAIYEVAVLDSDGILDYTTPIGSQPVGYISAEKAREIIIRISNLTPEGTEIEAPIKEIDA